MARTARTGKAACLNKGEKITAWSTPFGGNALGVAAFGGREWPVCILAARTGTPKAGSYSIENVDMAAS
jgi:hypothetical protein